MNWGAEPYHETMSRLLAEIAATRTAPKPEPTPWEIAKAAARLRRRIERVEKGKWLPPVGHKLSGRAARDLRQAYELLAKTEAAGPGGSGGIKTVETP
jgi:hypothetical protein